MSEAPLETSLHSTAHVTSSFLLSRLLYITRILEVAFAPRLPLTSPIAPFLRSHLGILVHFRVARTRFISSFC